MEELFSQRIGITKKKLMQIDSMDDELKTAIWNVIYEHVIKGYKFLDTFRQKESFAISIWTNFYKRTIDTVMSTGSYQDWNKFVAVFKKDYFLLEWYKIYDLIEYLLNDVGLYSGLQDDFIKECNAALEKELSAYRFVGKRLATITSSSEIQELNEAIDASSMFTDHLDRALGLLTNRTSPDYRNSIKESISAVEAICQLISGDNKATLSSTLKKLDSQIGTLHPALIAAFNKLYGYTSDAEGIRHAHLGESTVDFALARFILVTCSAFINYLLSNAFKAGIELRLPIVEEN